MASQRVVLRPSPTYLKKSLKRPYRRSPFSESSGEEEESTVRTSTSSSSQSQIVLVPAAPARPDTFALRFKVGALARSLDTPRPPEISPSASSTGRAIGEGGGAGEVETVEISGGRGVSRDLVSARRAKLHMKMWNT